MIDKKLPIWYRQHNRHTNITPIDYLIMHTDILIDCPYSTYELMTITRLKFRVISSTLSLMYIQPVTLVHTIANNDDKVFNDILLTRNH